MEFKIKSRVRHGHEFSPKAKKTAEDFAKAIKKELDSFVLSIVLFGSAAKRQGVDKSAKHDIDVLLVVDDASTVVTRELTEAYRIIVEKTAARVSMKLHISTLKVTTFWEYLKNGDPVLINILRDGHILDDAGFFKGAQALLDRGRIRPTKEAIWSYYTRVPVTMKNARAHILQACVDLYWAGIDASHAALMATGNVPPSPMHVPDMLEQHLVKKKLLDERYPVMMRELYDLSKHILHRDTKEISGAQFDDYLKETEELVRSLKRIVRDHEKKIK